MTSSHEWNTVHAQCSCTLSKIVASDSAVPSSSVTKMIRCPERTAGVCDATFTPAIITRAFCRRLRKRSARVTPSARNTSP